MPVLAILSFLKNNWQWVLLGVAILSLFAYVGALKFEVNHYKSQAADYHLKLDTIAEKENKLDQEAIAITRKYETIGNAQYQQQKKDAKANEQRIRNDKASSDIRIPVSAIELFNNSNNAANQTTAATKSVNDGETSTTSGSRTQQNRNGQDSQGQPILDAHQLVPLQHTSIAPDDVASEITLQDVLLVNNINRNRLLSCNASLQQWQGMWSDYSAAVKGNQ